MERLQHLISKLNEQNQQKESPLQMLVTLKHIEAELTIMHTAGGTARSNPGVSVVMPSINVGNRLSDQSPIPEAAEPLRPATGVVAEPFSLQPAIPAPQQPPVEQNIPEPEVAENYMAAPVNGSSPAIPYRNGSTVNAPHHTSPAAEALRKYQPQPASPVPEPPRNREPAFPKAEPVAPQNWSVDPLMEVPTLSHQPGAPELNDIIGMRNPSINDRLKDNGMKEAGYQLKGAPVKELRKAIGVNDRYLFINELFRGDEAMYERSIKTINNFRILPEAQYWMERELKIKIGWDDSRDIVQHFYELVSRRFS